jgi:hypothetical protein
VRGDGGAIVDEVRGGDAVRGVDTVGVKIASGTNFIASMREIEARHANAALLFAEYSGSGDDTITRTLVESKEGEERKSIGPANPSPESRQLAKVVRQAA